MRHETCGKILRNRKQNRTKSKFVGEHRPLVQTFKILKSIDKVESEKLFTKLSHGAGTTRLAGDPWNLGERGKAKKELGLQTFVLEKATNPRNWC